MVNFLFRYDNYFQEIFLGNRVSTQSLSMIMTMGIKEIRLAHLERAVQICGTAEELSRRMGVASVYISALRAGRRSIGHKTAASIEEVMGWPQGFMDTPVDESKLDEDILCLLKTLPEQQVLEAISEALPRISKDGLQKITASLLAAIAAPSPPEK